MRLLARLNRLATLAPLLALALGPVAAGRLQAQSGFGMITGQVRDLQGNDLAGVRAELLGSDRATMSIADGRFLLDSVPAGSHTLRLSLAGYLPAQARVRVAADSATTLDVVLVPDGQPLSPVRVTAKARGRVSGTVVDTAGRPLVGVSVGMVGVRQTVLTDSLGGFVFADLDPGQYLIEARRIGYELSRYPVRMADDLERVVTMRLRQGPRALTRTEFHNTEVAAREAHSRIAFRSLTRSMIMSRDELEAFGRSPLDIVLQRSRLRDYLRGAKSDANALDTMCVLVDGWRALGRGVARIDERGGWGRRAPSAPIDNGWLRTFYADDVEMLEVHVSDSENSRTLCGRFTYGSGCSCNPPYQTSPPTVVIWLRK